MRRSWLLASGSLIVLLSWHVATAEVPSSAWLMYKNPEDAGFSMSAIQRIKDYYARSGLACLFVVYRGRVVLALGDYQRRFQCHSIRKSLMNALMGIAVDEGKIDLNKILKDLGIDDVDGLTQEEKQATVRHLLQGRSGVYHPAVYETKSMARARPKRGGHRPGSFWYYNNWDFNVLSTILNQETGDDFLRLFKTRIAEPLEMEDYREFDGNYFLDPDISRHRGYGFKLSARDLARFGQLYLQKGSWNGARILSREWIEESTRSYSDTHTTRGGYGYLWWVPELRHSLQAFAACGVGTQVLLVLPALEMVIVQRVDTYAGKNHPFDPSLYEMIAEARNAGGRQSPEYLTLPVHQENENWTVNNGKDLIGVYRAADGTYQIQTYGDGLLMTYPQGMRALLRPWEKDGTFLVEDVFEVVRLEQPRPGEIGKLSVLGRTK
jgi:CubicO group peptidase (beta-lactamase class C family)